MKFDRKQSRLITFLFFSKIPEIQINEKTQMMIESWINDIDYDFSANPLNYNSCSNLWWRLYNLYDLSSVPLLFAETDVFENDKLISLKQSMVAFRYLSAIFVLQERKQTSETAGNRYSISQCSCISVLLQEITSDAIRTDLSPFLMKGKGRGGGHIHVHLKNL